MNKSHFIIPLTLFCLLLLFSSCGGDFSFDNSFFAMDTVISTSIYGNKPSLLENIAQEVEEETLRLEKLYDAEGEPLQALAHGEIATDGELTLLIRDSVALGKKTGGALDITLYPVITLWGFGTDAAAVPEKTLLENTLLLTGLDKVKFSDDGYVSLTNGSALTLGAVAKGYVGDKLATLAKEKGATAGILSLGGNVVLFGNRDGNPWKVAIRSPFEETENALMLSLLPEEEPLSCVTSGAYERYFVEDGVTYHHIIDPETGYPADNDLASVTVISSNGFMADGLSTALFVMGSEKASEYIAQYGACDSFQAILLLKDGSAILSQSLLPSVTSMDESITTVTLIPEESA